MTDKDNPYRPPASSGDSAHFYAGDSQPFSLATRGSRLAAAMIDGLCTLAVILPLAIGFGLFEALSAGDLGFGTQILGLALGFGVWLLLNGYFLHLRGQTLGKMVMKIKIVGYDNRRADLFRLVVLRMLPMQMLNMIPSIGSLLNLIDVVLIFGAEQRCFHDLLAGTKVVNVSST